MKVNFEVKLKGRLGSGPNDLKEMRVLNRIVRISDAGLLYEPNPRHVELLARALHLEGANSRACPGQKPQGSPEPPEPEIEDIAMLVAAVRSQRISNLRVTFGAVDTIHDAPDYYRSFPRLAMLNGQIGSDSFELVPCGHDAFTALSPGEQYNRRVEFGKRVPAKRSAILRQTLRKGAKWEISTTQIIRALPKKKRSIRNR